MVTTRAGRGGAAGRALWSFADQAVSSGTNFLLTILVARSVSADEFGAFAIGISAYLLCVTLGRSSVSEAVVLRLGRKEGLGAEDVAAGLKATLLLAVGASVLLVGVATLLPHEPSALILFVLAAGLPGLLVQDYRRIVFFALEQPKRAFTSDVLWAVLQLGGIVAATALEVGSPAVFLAIWAVAALLSGLLWPSVTRGWWRQDGSGWLRRNKDVVLPLAGEGFLFQFGNQAAVFLLGAIAGLAQAGAYRGAQTLFGPVIVLMLGLRTAVLPELMRLSRRSVGRALRVSTQVTAGVVLLVAVWGAALLAVPTSLGTEILGSTWVLAASLIALVIVEKASSAVTWGAVLRLRVLMRPRLSLALRTASSATSVAVACVGAPLAGARGVALGSAIMSPILAAAWLVSARAARSSASTADGSHDSARDEGGGERVDRSGIDAPTT